MRYFSKSNPALNPCDYRHQSEWVNSGKINVTLSTTGQKTIFQKIAIIWGSIPSFGVLMTVAQKQTVADTTAGDLGS